jgi:adenylate kinase
MNFALVGPTCAGKTTQSAILNDYYCLHHVSPGMLLREHREQRTALGIMSRRYIERGELVPDEVVGAVIEEAVCHTAQMEGLMFDGFPMTEFQARFLDELLETYKRHLDAVIYLQIPESMVFKRAAKRIPKREDDSAEVLRHRLRVFERSTAPVLKYFAETHRLVVVHADEPVDKVFHAISDVVDELAAGRTPRIPKLDQDWLSALWEEPAIPATGARKPSLNLVLLGGPGCGKGTHAAYLSEQLSLPTISTGNIFRANIANKTPLGRIAQTYIDRGELCPDDVTEDMVDDRLAADDAARGFLLDGFPRTMPQVHALDEILAKMGRKLDGVIYLNVPDEEIMFRTSGRRICPVCQSSYHTSYKRPKKAGVCDKDGAQLIQREDDEPDTVRSRLKAFHGQTAPLIDHYRKRGLLVEVSGNGSVDEVRASMLSAAQRWPAAV